MNGTVDALTNAKLSMLADSSGSQTTGRKDAVGKPINHLCLYALGVGADWSRDTSLLSVSRDATRFFFSFAPRNTKLLLSQMR